MGGTVVLAGVAVGLVLTAIGHARASGNARMVLVSNSKLQAALRLYESMGFTHRPAPAVLPYHTADVFMEMRLD